MESLLRIVLVLIGFIGIFLFSAKRKKENVLWLGISSFIFFVITLGYTIRYEFIYVFFYGALSFVLFLIYRTEKNRN